MLLRHGVVPTAAHLAAAALAGAVAAWDGLSAAAVTAAAAAIEAAAAAATGSAGTMMQLQPSQPWVLLTHLLLLHTPHKGAHSSDVAAAGASSIICGSSNRVGSSNSSSGGGGCGGCSELAAIRAGGLSDIVLEALGMLLPPPAVGSSAGGVTTQVSFGPCSFRAVVPFLRLPEHLKPVMIVRGDARGVLRIAPNPRTDDDALAGWAWERPLGRAAASFLSRALACLDTKRWQALQTATLMGAPAAAAAGSPASSSTAAPPMAAAVSAEAAVPVLAAAAQATVSLTTAAASPAAAPAVVPTEAAANATEDGMRLHLAAARLRAVLSSLHLEE